MKKPAWIDEFVAFAVKGNAMALAVGTIIGAAFSTITKSLTDDIIMPIIAIFMGGIDFTELKIVLPRLFGEPVLDEAGNEILNTLNWGNFISAVINFFILAFVVFMLVKGLNKLSEIGKKQEEDHQGQDGEVDDGGEEVAVVQGVEDLVAGLVQDGLAEEAGQDDLQLGEIDAAHEDGDNGHDDVVGQGLGDGGEGGADDGTDSQSHGVALDGKGHEFIPPGGLDFRHSM